MDVDAFVRRLEGLKSAAERDLSIRRYPFQTLDNLKLIEQLFAQAHLAPPASGRMLDVGCGDGDLGFYYSARGHAVDMMDFPETNQNQMQMVRQLATQLSGGHTVSSVDLDRGLPTLDEFYTLAVTLGLIYHLKNPFLLMSDLATVSNYAVVSTRIVDGAMLPEEQAAAYLVSDQQLGEDNTNFWLFNAAGFGRLAQRSGWNILSRIRFGDLKRGDASKHDAREALLLASRYSVFPGVRVSSGLNRVEYGSYRWTRDRFTLELDATDKPLNVRYFLPEGWLDSHKLRAFAGGEELELSVQLSSSECLARISHPAKHLELRCENPSVADERPLGVVLKMDPNQAPFWLE